MWEYLPTGVAKWHVAQCVGPVDEVVWRDTEGSPMTTSALIYTWKTKYFTFIFLSVST